MFGNLNAFATSFSDFTTLKVYFRKVDLYSFSNIASARNLFAVLAISLSVDRQLAVAAGCWLLLLASF